MKKLNHKEGEMKILVFLILWNGFFVLIFSVLEIFVLYLLVAYKRYDLPHLSLSIAALAGFGYIIFMFLSRINVKIKEIKKFKSETY